MEGRIYNFSAGPAVLPETVIAEARDNLLNYKNSGLGLLEMSHRGSQFSEIIAGTETALRDLVGISDDYAVLFTTGGASNQFSMVPMNLLPKGATADYIISGAWSEKAEQEGKKFGNAHTAGTSADCNFRSLPKTITLSENPAYVHFTSNNTIFGTQYQVEPDSQGAPLVCDASSDFLCRPLDISKYGVIYAGAQKNLGPAGVTIVVIRKDLLARSSKSLPTMMNYNTYASSDSLYNTPPCFPIYIVGEVVKWIKSLGGLSAMHEHNIRKAAVLYNYMDSTSFYVPYADQADRSLMNVTFRLQNTELEGPFAKQATAAGFDGLKGHRSVGGLRASIYNAFPIEGVEKLVAFMKEFERANG